jgi:hypothetical protein
VATELASRAAIRGELHESVAKFANLNLLLSYQSDNVDKNACVLPQVERQAAYRPVLALNAAPEVEEVEYSNVEPRILEGGELEAEQEDVTLPAGVELIPQVEVTTQDYVDAVEGLRVMVELTEGQERQMYLDAIEGLEVMVELAAA